MMDSELKDTRKHYVQKLFSNIAHNYDRLNGIISFGFHHQWRKFAISKAQLIPGNLILDLCSGTADFAICAAKENEGIRVIGLDFCDEMLEIGKEKIKKIGLSDRIELKKASLPATSIQGFRESHSVRVCDSIDSKICLLFKENTFDVVTIGFGLRHLNISGIFNEVERVLKPEGRLITLDAAKPTGLVMKGLHRIYFYRILPLLGRIFHGDKEPYNYLPKSLDLYLPDKEGLKKLMEKAGFVEVQYFNLLGGVATVHLGFKNG
ncbi:MAG: class I SAM-dependent methyltransferase [bacterium]|nr:class I SAM-dependent methyltransferase [bacterium]